MKYKKMKNARWSFSLMVPLTLIAFVLAFYTVNGNVQVIHSSTFLDYIAIPLVAIGVILYNCVDEPLQKVLTEKF